MKIKDLNYLETVHGSRAASLLQGSGETAAAGYVATGDGIAAAGAYAGAVGSSVATQVNIAVHSQQGAWSNISSAKASARAIAQTGAERSRSSFSARSTYFGFGNSFMQLDSFSAFSSR